MEKPRQPLQQGAVYTGTVEGYSSDGYGIVRLDGAVVFVRRSVPISAAAAAVTSST